MISWRTWELLPTPDIVLEKLKDIYVLDESVQNLAQGLNRDPSVLPDAIVDYMYAISVRLKHNVYTPRRAGTKPDSLQEK
jgi:hypothetical protein